ncbi:MAG: RNA methyltransferase [Cyclobacteriaceae bacterium]
MGKNNAEAIISTLEEFVSEHKKDLVDQVLENRTRHLTLVFEDIDKPHNISAVIRTAECLGVQDIHFIKNKNEYSVNPTITQGASKWLTFHHYEEESNNIDACYSFLRANGYKIYATALHKEAKSVDELNVNEKIAIVFGTESDGISKEAGEKADGLVHIPMFGFTESFNLSVSAALCLNTIRGKLKGAFPGITTKEKVELRAEWYRRIVREADLILKTKGVKV